MGINFTSSYGQTTLSEEEKLGLKYSYITTNAELNEMEMLNIQAAVLWSNTLSLTPAEILSEAFIKKLHTRMYGDTWKWAGNYRTSDKNIGVPWRQVPMALKQLLDDAQFWIANETYDKEEIAVRFKHRLVAIHCFPNGNGRHSRLLADILMTTGYRTSPFTWGSLSYKSNKILRETYINALRQADKNDIKGLMAFATS